MLTCSKSNAVDFISRNFETGDGVRQSFYARTNLIVVVVLSQSQSASNYSSFYIPANGIWRFFHGCRARGKIRSGMWFAEIHLIAAARDRDI